MLGDGLPIGRNLFNGLIVLHSESLELLQKVISVRDQVTELPLEIGFLVVVSNFFSPAVGDQFVNLLDLLHGVEVLIFQLFDVVHLALEVLILVSVILGVPLRLLLELPELSDEVGRRSLTVLDFVPEIGVLAPLEPQVVLHVPVDLVGVVLSVDHPVHLVDIFGGTVHLGQQAVFLLGDPFEFLKY
jgi:hypothetical protein